MEWNINKSDNLTSLEQWYERCRRLQVLMVTSYSLQDPVTVLWMEPNNSSEIHNMLNILIRLQDHHNSNLKLGWKKKWNILYDCSQYPRSMVIFSNNVFFFLAFR